MRIFIHIILLLGLGIFFSFIFFSTKGTGDVNYWQEMIHNGRKYGFSQGYMQNKGYYPPLSSTILVGSDKLMDILGTSPIIEIKLTVLIFLLVTVIVYYTITKNFILSIFFLLSLFLSSLGLIYLDILFAPFLLLSFFSLKHDRIILSAVFFAISFMIKWQPLILYPFIIIYLSGISSSKISKFKIKNIIQFIVTTFLISSILILLYQNEVILAFFRTISTNSLSANALNFNWIITYLIELIFPSLFGGLVNGLVKPIILTPAIFNLLPKIIFIFFYSLILFRFIKEKKDFYHFVVYCLIGFLSYFEFNTEVHENHLFTANILSFILIYSTSDIIYLLWPLIFNINLFIFYGLGGQGMFFSRVIGGIDISVVFAALSVIIFFYFLKRLINKQIF